MKVSATAKPAPPQLIRMCPKGVRVSDHMHIHGLSFDKALRRAEREFAEEQRQGRTAGKENYRAG